MKRLALAGMMLMVSGMLHARQYYPKPPIGDGPPIISTAICPTIPFSQWVPVIYPEPSEKSWDLWLDQDDKPLICKAGGHMVFLWVEKGLYQLRKPLKKK